MVDTAHGTAAAAAREPAHVEEEEPSDQKESKTESKAESKKGK